MLTIKNYYKACDKPVGDNGWRVWSVDEHDDTYEFVLYKFNDSRIIHLERTLTQRMNGKWSYQFLREDGQATVASATADYLQDIPHLLNNLAWFVR